jgi:RNA polymerase sigma-70 factor, ECF subfamily
MNKLKQNLLVKRCRQNDVEAFRQIYHFFLDRVHIFVSYRVGNLEDAQDLDQEIFVDLWKYLSESDKEVSNLQALVYKIAKNKISKYYQQRNLQKEISPQDRIELGQVKHQIKSDSNLEEDLQIKMMIEKIKKVIKKIDHRDYQEILELKYIDQLKTKEIAIMIGKTESSVRVSLHRAIKRLKKELEIIDKQP